MATEDCTEVGRGSCPCGKGEIMVERCTPDHGYVQAHQISYEGRLDCRDCATEYSFWGDRPDVPPRLVLKVDVAKRDQFRMQWHAKIKAIEASPDFHELRKNFAQWLGPGRPATVRHRMIREAGVDNGVTLARFRRDGFTLEARRVLPALKVVPVHLPALEDLAKEAESLWKQGQAGPPAIKTGVCGLEA